MSLLKIAFEKLPPSQRSSLENAMVGNNHISLHGNSHIGLVGSAEATETETEAEM